jgi:hypothetical protein
LANIHSFSIENQRQRLAYTIGCLVPENILTSQRLTLKAFGS